MLGSPIIEVALGLAFVYLILSLVCSALNELLAGWLRLRSKNLEQGIRNMLNDPEGTDIAGKLYQHALVTALGKGRGAQKPSYMPPRVFATALLDILKFTSPESTTRTAARMREAIADIDSPSLQESLRTLLDEAEGDVKAFRVSLERWFDDAMDRASGWYKRKIQLVLLALAAALTVVLNADTLQIGDTLLRDDAARAALVARAERFAAAPEDTAAAPLAELQRLNAEIQQSRIPLGWKGVPDGFGGWVAKIGGLILTALAVSLGAPFWFDLLSRVSSLRASGRKPASS